MLFAQENNSSMLCTLQTAVNERATHLPKL